MSRYNFRKRSDDSMLYNDEPSLTKQEFAASCDINNILKSYARNGNNPFVLAEGAKFGDFTNVPSYQEALDLVNSASARFDQLPADLRFRFANDPGQLLDFLSDPNNREEAIKLGLVQEKTSDPLDLSISATPKDESPAP